MVHTHRAPARSSPTVQQVLAAFAPAVLARPGVDHHVRDVLERLLVCRTAALGGRLQRCRACGHEVPIYNSCRNRHCSQCQGLERARWIEARIARTLPVRHVHMVFTVPAALRPLAGWAPRLLYDAMFHAIRDTLDGLGRERLGARIGFTAVLHTWNQQLQRHPHIHCIVTAGGLALDDSGWVHGPRERYLFPQAQLSRRFQHHLLQRIDHHHRKGDLDPGAVEALGVDQDPKRGWKAWLRARYAERWIVYAKVPLANAEQVIRYLGQYTHRVAIANSRILSLDREAGTVTIGTRRGPRTLRGDVFVRRFMQHVLPHGFRKIRHYGLLAPSNVKRRLPLARALLGGRAPDADPPDTAEFPPTGEPDVRDELPSDWMALASTLLGLDLRQCPACGQHAVIQLPLTQARGPP